MMTIYDNNYYNNYFNMFKFNWTIINSPNRGVLYCNPKTLDIDYKFLKNRMDIIREELMMKVFHPERLQRLIVLGYSIEDITDY